MTTTSIGRLAHDYIAEQCRVLREAGPQLREREPVVHDTRVATRRLRSTLRIFGDLFEIPAGGWLSDELHWWAGLLGAVRDLDVLAERLGAQLDELPGELVVGPVRSRIDLELSVDRHRAWDAVHAALDQERYSRLSAALQRWQERPPFSDAAERPAKRVRDYVTKAGRKADRRLREAVRAYEEGAEGADDLLHRARRAGKRHRYAGELAEPWWGDKASAVVEHRKAVQDVLGEHQDARVSAAWLRALGVRTGSEEGHNGFTYGLLYASERHRLHHLMDDLTPWLGKGAR